MSWFSEVIYLLRSIKANTDKIIEGLTIPEDFAKEDQVVRQTTQIVDDAKERIPNRTQNPT